MKQVKHIFIPELRQDKKFWGIYIALVWAIFIGIGIIDDTINSAANPNSILLLSSLGLLGITAILFVMPSKIGWCLVVAIHIVQALGSLFGAFGVLATATLDGEHIIGMARNGVGTALGLIMVVYLFQEFIRDVYGIKVAPAIEEEPAPKDSKKPKKPKKRGK